MKNQNHKSHVKCQMLLVKNGFTLIEIVIVIGLIASLIAVLAASLSSAPLVRKSALRTQAHELLSEELSRLKTRPFTELINRTDGRFVSVLYNQGPWRVVSDAPRSAPQALAISPQARTVGPARITSVLKVPVGEVTDFDIQTAIRIEDITINANWRVGIFFRARDNENQYRVALRNNRLVIEKVENGLISSLSSTTIITDLERWYTLRVRMIGSNIEVWLNDALIAQVSDTSFLRGLVGLISTDEGFMSIDDVTLSLPQSRTWNFDNDELGDLPNSWRDFGVYELPQGTDFLTIRDYVGSSSIKHIIARIDWQENNATSTARLETLISN